MVVRCKVEMGFGMVLGFIGQSVVMNIVFEDESDFDFMFVLGNLSFRVLGGGSINLGDLCLDIGGGGVIYLGISMLGLVQFLDIENENICRVVYVFVWCSFVM